MVFHAASVQPETLAWNQGLEAVALAELAGGFLKRGKHENR